MTVRVLLLRAVNVGGAKLPMARLREIVTELGGGDARSYIASGNVIADVPGDAAAFDRSLEQAVEAEFGFFREVISRTPDELRTALDAHPFEVLEPKFSYVSFMTAEPTAEALAAAAEVPTGDDRWQVVGRDLHLRYADGAGRPQLKTDMLLRRLGVPTTARNVRTVAALIELAATP